MKILTKLDTINIKNISKIKRIPGIEKINTSTEKLYGIKYFLFTSKFNKTPIVIRITSLNKSFDQPYSIDLYNKKMKPVITIVIKPETPEKVFLTMISLLPKSIKYVKTESNILGNYLERLNELKLDFMKISFIFQGITLVTSFLLLVRYYITEVRKKAEEEMAGREAESDINNKLFVGQKSDEPAFKMYANLENFITFVALGKAPACILCGPPGMSKTYIVRRTFHFNGLKPGKDYNIEKGSSLSVQATYDLLYKNKNKILVLDDFDTPLKSEDTVNLLKAITDSYDRRILSLPAIATVSSKEEITSNSPNKFEYKGKLIIITNLKKSELDRALISRAPAFEVTFNSKEILVALEKMLRFINPGVPIEIKREVLDYILILYNKNPKIELDFRAFKCAVDARVGNPMYWKEMVKTITGIS